jgi:Tfp pilus assembly protein PilF
MNRITALRAQLGGKRDNAMLRYSLGAELLKAGDTVEAIEHLHAALGKDAGYSAAWKLLGKALLSVGDVPGAADTWRHGIVAAQARGDVQAAREMRVFLGRLQRSG